MGPFCNLQGKKHPLSIPKKKCKENIFSFICLSFGWFFFFYIYMFSNSFSHIKTTDMCVTIQRMFLRSSLGVINVLSSSCPHVCAAQDSIILYFYVRLQNTLPRAYLRVPFHPRTRGWASVSTLRGSNREEKCRQKSSLTANIKTRRTQWTRTKERTL